MRYLVLKICERNKAGKGEIDVIYEFARFSKSPAENAKEICEFFWGILEGKIECEMYSYAIEKFSESATGYHFNEKKLEIVD